MEEKQIVEDRVRMNVSTTAKGTAQVDVTVEFKTEEESAKNLIKALADIKKIVTDSGFKMAGE
jgi:hypothetical protein